MDKNQIEKIEKLLTYTNKDINRIAEVIFDETKMDWEICLLCAKSIVKKEWRQG